MTCALPPNKSSQQHYETPPQDRQHGLPNLAFEGQVHTSLLMAELVASDRQLEVSHDGKPSTTETRRHCRGGFISHWKAGSSNSALRSLDTSIMHITFTGPEEEDRVQ